MWECEWQENEGDGFQTELPYAVQNNYFKIKFRNKFNILITWDMIFLTKCEQ
jgi:hypothetical protein